MLLSILIPSVPKRLTNQLPILFAKLEAQAASYPNVEILALLDNKRRSIGMKRDALVQAAIGDYLSFVDDDDDVAPDYVATIMETLATSAPDVLCFNQQTVVNNSNPFIVRHSREFQNESARIDENGIWCDITRQPWHHCVWRSVLAKRHHFPDISYGEDWAWCEKVLADVKSEVRIDRVLHYYRFNDAVTEAVL